MKLCAACWTLETVILVKHVCVQYDMSMSFAAGRDIGYVKGGRGGVKR